MDLKFRAYKSGQGRGVSRGGTDAKLIKTASTEEAFLLLTQQPRVRILAQQISLYCLVCGQYRDQTHLVPMQGISQMQFSTLKQLLPLCRLNMPLPSPRVKRSLKPDWRH